jgi:hypothetical protein
VPGKCCGYLPDRDELKHRHDRIPWGYKLASPLLTEVLFWLGW